MDEGAVIIDISSDEETLVNESFDLSEDWLDELLESIDVGALEDFADVMIVEELFAPSCMKKLAPLEKDSDEDCIILDGDPDKLLSVIDGKNESAYGGAELLIVGEKGQCPYYFMCNKTWKEGINSTSFLKFIMSSPKWCLSIPFKLACRDYPHPRHLCLSFPFSSTPHDKHCKLCHCYVCDSPAPCIYWGNKFSMADHCHATDKETAWKSLRSQFKLVTSKSSGRGPVPSSIESQLFPIRHSSQRAGRIFRSSLNHMRSGINPQKFCGDLSRSQSTPSCFP